MARVPIGDGLAFLPSNYGEPTPAAPPASVARHSPSNTSSLDYNAMLMGMMQSGGAAGDANVPENYDDEPPLLEELGINFRHISHKTISVLNPIKLNDQHIMDDTDLAGPLVFCLLFGGFLLFSGKVHFGYIYGVGVLGCLSMYLLINLMSDVSLSLAQTVSILGYCLLPMVLLSVFSMLLSLQGFIGMYLALASMAWCTASASKMFVTVLSMRDSLTLVAYPCAIIYGVFALLAVF